MTRTRRRRPVEATLATKYVVVGLVLTGLVATPLLIWTELAWYFGPLLGVNVATFLLYGWDKWMARRGAMRVPERVLHIFCFAFGSPGAFAGQRVFRHKTRKGSFQLVFWGLVVVQLALIGWLLWLRFGGTGG